VAQGGLGNLNAETSKALVVGTILQPRFAFLPDTEINLAVDYFDIRVKGEIAQLGARNIIFGCYDSENFPNDPLCSLFTRGQAAAPNNINQVFDKFINIASQRNSGIDLNFNVRHDLGSLGKVSFTADMTWQLRDKITLLPGSPSESDNGEAGSPKWIGDFRLNWQPSESLGFFYGLSVIGATSNMKEFLDDNGGDPCLDSFLDDEQTIPIRGRYCPDLSAKAKFYHNASITQDINDRFSFTLGVNNLFDSRPPRVSVLNGGQISMLGPVVAASQYGFLGRRVFINVTSKF
jgi:iron complex outermembrane receptor protein